MTHRTHAMASEMCKLGRTHSLGSGASTFVTRTLLSGPIPEYTEPMCGVNSEICGDTIAVGVRSVALSVRTIRKY